MKLIMTTIAFTFLIMVGTALADSSCPPPVYVCDTNGNCQWVQMVQCK